MDKRTCVIGISRFVSLNVLIACCFTQAESFSQDFHTGAALERALSESVTASLPDKTVRSVLDSMGKQRGIAVVLDRRLDPDTSISIQASTARDAFQQVADKCDGVVSELPNLVFIGPRESAGKLHTLVKLKAREVSKLANRRTLRETRDIQWPLLSEPKQVLTQVAKQFGVEVENGESVPHDLWGAAVIPDADAVTTLSVLLIQFGATFEWEEKGRRIRIVPEPETVSMDGKVRVKSTAPDNLLELIGQRFPRAKVRKSGSSLIVKGTYETIEAIRQLASGEQVQGQQKPQRVDLLNPSLTFTGKFIATARQIIDKFIETGTPIELDEAALRAAGVDLNKRIELELNEASTKETFRLLSEQIGVNFTVEKYRVRLFPKR